MTKNRFFSQSASFINLMLFFLTGVVGYYLIATLTGLTDTGFVISVREKAAGIAYDLNNGYHLSHRHVYSLLHINPKSFLDYLLLDKKIGCNIFQLLLSLLAIYQIFKINKNWYDKKFTSELYRMIDTLSIMAALMWLFSRIQEFYQKSWIKEISADQLALDGCNVFFYVGLVLLLISGVLKSFAKHGSKLQEEQDLTI
jgi:hypothetical protein